MQNQLCSIEPLQMQNESTEDLQQIICLIYIYINTCTCWIQPTKNFINPNSRSASSVIPNPRILVEAVRGSRAAIPEGVWEQGSAVPFHLPEEDGCTGGRRLRAGGRLGAWNGEAGRGDSRAGDRETPGLQNLEAASTNMAIMAEQGVGRPPGCRTWRQRQRTWRIRSADRRRATAPGAGERRSNGVGL
ncbi:hypothetical protein BRADI_1g35577v3 [Brachypodium distachyon]|uniref:Uncharacterized protein n=1 Tax=Brachypodium distachyon TaxID=15368 RepID=A0A0Q3H542_BRADI|nr:hypothetical protein BRADI_1g35577v3 [Brachypodium distachyon]